MANDQNIRQNPFRHMGQWYWYDEAQFTHGPYATQYAALIDLLAHIHWLDTGKMPWSYRWRRFWSKVAAFARA